MITEEMKKKALDDLEHLTVQQLVERFERIGSVRLRKGESFDLHKFMDEEMERLFGTCEDGWDEYATYEIGGTNNVVDIYPNDFHDVFAA